MRFLYDKRSVCQRKQSITQNRAPNVSNESNVPQDFVVLAMSMVKCSPMKGSCQLHRAVQPRPSANYDYSPNDVPLMDSMELGVKKNRCDFVVVFNNTKIDGNFRNNSAVYLQCNRLLFDGGVLWSSKPADPPCILKWTGPDGGYRRFIWPCSSVDSGESKLSDFMRKFNFWRRGEWGAIVLFSLVMKIIGWSINAIFFTSAWLNFAKSLKNMQSKSEEQKNRPCIQIFWNKKYQIYSIYMHVVCSAGSSEIKWFQQSAEEEENEEEDEKKTHADIRIS